MCSPHLRSGELGSISLRSDYLHKLNGIMRERFVSSAFIYLFIQSLIYFSVKSWILIFHFGLCPIWIIALSVSDRASLHHCLSFSGVSRLFLLACPS